MSGKGKLGMKKKTFVQLLLSYLLVLSIPIVVGSYAYGKTVSVIKDGVMYSSLSSLEQSRDILDRQLEEMDSIVLNLSLDPDIRGFMNTNQPLTDDDYYKVYKIVTNLRKYKITNNFIESFYIYFKNSNLIISPDTMYKLPESYGEFLKHGDLSYSEYSKQILNANPLASYVTSSVVKHGNKVTDMVSYVSSLPAHSISGGFGSGTVVILIDQKEFSKLLSHNQLIQDGWVYVLDEKNQVISSVTNREGTLLPLDMAGNSGSMTRKLNGENMVVSYTTSEYSGWKFIAVAPTSIVLAKVGYIKKITMMIVASMLIFGILAALWLASRNSRPIRELVEIIKDSLGGEAALDMNEYDLVKGSIHMIVDNNKSMKHDMESQMPFLQAAFFDRLFKGEFHNEKNIRTVLSQVRLQIEGKQYAVFVLHIEGYRDLITEDILQELNAAKVILKSSLDQIFRKRGHIHEIGGNKVAYLLPFEEEDDDRNIRETIHSFGKVYDSFYEQCDLKLSISAGRYYPTLNDVWHSYKQALQALDYKNPDHQQHIVFYDSIPVDPTEYYYPMDLETRLMNTIKAGDRDEVHKLLQLLHEENFHKRRLSSLMSRQLINELRGTLIKLLGQIKVSISLSDQELKELFNPSARAERDVYRSIEAVCYSISDRVEKQKKSNNTNLIQSVLEYIQNSYMNPDLSLTSIASEFDLTETYISQFFKEQTGENYSAYIERLRMHRACELLNEDKLTIGEIAEQVGYNSDQAFRRAFKRVLGVQPTAYRKSDTNIFSVL